MKRFTALLLALSLGVLAVTACSKNASSGTAEIKPIDGKSLSDVITAVDAKFAEKHGADYTAVAMGMPIDAQYITDFLGVNAADVEEYAGSVSMSMTNSDAFFGIKAKSDKVDILKAALDQRRQDLIAQYERYPVNGSYERAQAGEVYQKGNYLFLIVVGYMPDHDGAALDFAPDVTLVKQTIDSQFTA
ncbi:MAG: DUF4358 domain-containing protein [Oscillospiraceae bacterium]